MYAYRFELLVFGTFLTDWKIPEENSSGIFYFLCFLGTEEEQLPPTGAVQTPDQITGISANGAFSGVGIVVAVFGLQRQTCGAI